MLKVLIALQLFYVLSTGTSVNSKHDFIASPRTSRQANKFNDPISIVKKQCIEYSKARFLGPKVSGKPSLNCVTTKPFVVDGVPSRLKEFPHMVRKRAVFRPFVVDGVPSRLNEFPHMALIGYNDRNDNISGVEWRCGGTLISDTYVLTAAHCITENSAPKWVRLGELIVDDDRDRAEPKDYRIVERIPHPLYRRPFILNDIMLLKLSEPVTFTSHIRPICLYPAEDAATVYNNSAIITGWGVTETGEQQSNELLKAKVDFSADSICTSYYAKDKQHLPNGFDSEIMICAGDKNGRKDSCRGDSGGPLQMPMKDLVCMFWQVGITSYGPFICGQKGVSSIYTKVSYYIPWIQSIVWPL